MRYSFNVPMYTLTIRNTSCICIAGARWDSSILANILLEKQDRGEVLPTDPERPTTPPDTPMDGRWQYTRGQGMIHKDTHVYSMFSCEMNFLL